VCVEILGSLTPIKGTSSDTRDRQFATLLHSILFGLRALVFLVEEDSLPTTVPSNATFYASYARI
jgi:hypothetical protein